jgi:hypothetical protein
MSQILTWPHLSNNPLNWPWWFQLPFTTIALQTLAFTVYAFITLRRELRRHRRWMRIHTERTARIHEDVCWRLYRQREYEHALRLRAERLTREQPIPQRLLKAVL